MDAEKQKVVDVVIEHLKNDFASGDYTVIEELLSLLPIPELVQSLPEEKWSKYGV